MPRNAKKRKNNTPNPTNDHIKIGITIMLQL